MKKLLNTLFVTTQGAYLSKEGETVVVKIDGEVSLRVPVHTLGRIVCFGQVSCSPVPMGFCAENGVAISFLTENGGFLAKVQGKGFKKKESGAVWMDDDTRKTVLVAYQKRKQEEIEHPFLKEKMANGLFPYAQALLIARYLRGDIDSYPPFIWK